MTQSPSPSDDTVGTDAAAPPDLPPGMGLSAYQHFAAKTALYSDNVRVLRADGSSVALYPFLGLGEAGEVQGKIKKVLRDSSGILTEPRRIELMYELGDVLWYVSECARQLGYDLSYVARMNILKLQDRAHRNKLQGSGDNR